MNGISKGGGDKRGSIIAAPTLVCLRVRESERERERELRVVTLGSLYFIYSSFNFVN